MNHAQILSENANTKRILANLSLAIDEARLVRQISEFSDNLRRIENQTEASARSRYLRIEIARLEQELAETRLVAKSRVLEAG